MNETRVPGRSCWKPRSVRSQLVLTASIIVVISTCVLSVLSTRPDLLLSQEEGECEVDVGEEATAC